MQLRLEELLDIEVIDMPFEECVKLIAQRAKINVVLDPASLDRLELTPKSTVRLVVEDVRLKTGLKLLFDQVGLTTRILPEDNLLLIADKTESDEPLDRVLEEIKAIHRDIHGLQDDFRDLRDSILPAGDDPQPRMRNPTIIEEKPDHGSDGKADGTKKSEKSARARPGV